MGAIRNLTAEFFFTFRIAASDDVSDDDESGDGVRCAASNYGK